MSEDELLRRMGRLAREEREAGQARLDERWDRLAAGTLLPEEEAELRALAATSPEAADAYEAFRPLGPDFQARIVAALARQRDEEPQVAPPRPRPAWYQAVVNRAGWLTAATAAAAAASVILLRNPALPLYVAAPIHGEQLGRGTGGSTAGPAILSPGSKLQMVVRPQQEASGKVVARSFLARGADLVPWESEPGLEISREGTVRLRGRLGQEIQIPPGDWRIWIVVGRPGKIPPPAELQAALRAGRLRHRGWQAVYGDLRVASRPPP